MSELLRSIANYLAMATIPAILISCILYLTLAATRRGGADRTTLAYARSSVRFHGVWGMVLSLPLVVGGASTSFGAAAHWSGQLLLVAALGCWVVAIAAIMGRPVPAALTWLPLVVTLVTLLALPSGSESFGAYVFWFAAYSLAGIGLAAWVLVSVSFALSVRRAGLSLVEVRPDLVDAPGFVWPT